MDLLVPLGLDIHIYLDNLCFLLDLLVLLVLVVLSFHEVLCLPLVRDIRLGLGVHNLLLVL